MTDKSKYEIDRFKGEVEMTDLKWFRRPCLGLLRLPRSFDPNRKLRWRDTVKVRAMCVWQVVFGRPVIYRVDMPWPVPVADAVSERNYPVTMMDCTLVDYRPPSGGMRQVGSSQEGLSFLESWN